MQLRWPLPSRYTTITTPYGEDGHNAVDIACLDGAQVFACMAGILTGEWTDMGGHVARITGADGWVSRYCHLATPIRVDGAHVGAGDFVGLVGKTGSAWTGYHLHWETRVYGIAVDPLLYWREENEGMRKTSIHYENAPTEEQRKRIAASNLSVIKMVWPCQVIPGKVCISRIWIGGDGEESKYVARGKQGAQEYFDRNLPTYQAYPGMVWISANEPSTATVAACRLLAEFLIEWARLMHANGFKCGGPELGEGQPGDENDPRYDKLVALAPAIMVMDYFTLHAYWCPPEATYTNDWHSLRYRMIFADLRKAGYTAWPPLVLDECGIDRGVIGKPGGFRNIPVTEQAYVAQIMMFDQELCKDSVVLACTIYGANWNPMWESFSITGYVEDQIFALAEAKPIPPPVHEGLPEDETTTDPAIMSEKIRWWSEESQRQYEAGNVARANSIRISNIQLCYRLENLLKAA